LLGRGQDREKAETYNCGICGFPEAQGCTLEALRAAHSCPHYGPRSAKGGNAHGQSSGRAGNTRTDLPWVVEGPRSGVAVRHQLGDRGTSTRLTRP